jgi:hypothetical protein
VSISSKLLEAQDVKTIFKATKKYKANKSPKTERDITER